MPLSSTVQIIFSLLLFIDGCLAKSLLLRSGRLKSQVHFQLSSPCLISKISPPPSLSPASVLLYYYIPPVLAPEIITRRFPSSCIEIGVIAFLLQALVSPYLVVRTRVLRGTAHWHLATRVLAPCAHLSPLLLLYLPLHKQLSKLLSLFTAYVSFSAIKCH